MRRFHDFFFNIIFGVFFSNWPNCATEAGAAADGSWRGAAMASSHRRANELRFVGA